MWIEGKWHEECEISDFLKKEREKAYREGYLAAVDTMSKEVAPELSEVCRQRDAYRQELIDTLKTATQCVGYPDDDCSICPYYYIVAAGGCPSRLRVTEAKKRLEELCGEKS